ncbi:hypothetical protein SALBM135S_01376 [Streptomyces alboniger]
MLVEAAAFLPGPAVAVTAHGDVDDARVDLGDLLGGEAEPGHLGGPVVVHEHVGGAEEVVEGATAFAVGVGLGLQGQPGRAQADAGLVPAQVVVEGVGFAHVQDVGALLGEDPAGRGAREDMGELQGAQTGQRLSARQRTRRGVAHALDGHQGFGQHGLALGMGEELLPAADDRQGDAQGCRLLLELPGDTARDGRADVLAGVRGAEQVEEGVAGVGVAGDRDGPAVVRGAVQIPQGGGESAVEPEDAAHVRAVAVQGVAAAEVGRELVQRLAQIQAETLGAARRGLPDLRRADRRGQRAMPIAEPSRMVEGTRGSRPSTTSSLTASSRERPSVLSVLSNSSITSNSFAFMSGNITPIRGRQTGRSIFPWRLQGNTEGREKPPSVSYQFTISSLSGRAVSIAGLHVDS